MLRKKQFKFPVSILIGSSFSNFRKVLNGRRIDFKVKCFLTGLISFLLGFINKPAENKNLKIIAHVNITEPPVYIIAFWRSGTTLLHNLLCCDPDAAYITTFQTVFPHHCTGNQWWLKRIAKPFLPPERPVDRVKFDFDLPQEEEIALGNLQSLSFYKFMYFPDDFDRFLQRDLLLQDITPVEFKIWKESYIRLIKTAMINTGGKRFISKNPPNGFRIRILLEMFPDARFINIFRDPEIVLDSFHRFIPLVIRGIGLQRYDPEEMEQNLTFLFNLYQKKYMENKKLIPRENLAEIDYTDIISSKKETIKNIYEDLRLPGFDNAVPPIDKYLSSMQDFYPQANHNDNS